MKGFKLFLMAAVVIGMGSLVSCSKESTPAEEIENTTQKMEGEAAKLQKEADATANKLLDKTKKVELPK